MKSSRLLWVSFAVGAIVCGPAAAYADDTIASSETVTVMAETQAPADLSAPAPAAEPAVAHFEPTVDAAVAIPAQVEPVAMEVPTIEPVQAKAELPVDIALPAAEVPAAPAESVSLEPVKYEIQPVSTPEQRKLAEEDLVARTTVEPGVTVVDQAAIDAALAEEERKAQLESDAANNAVEEDAQVIKDNQQAIADQAAAEGSATTGDTSTTTGGIEYCAQDESGKYTIRHASAEALSKGGAGPCVPETPDVVPCPAPTHSDYEGGPCHIDETETPEPETPDVPDTDVDTDVDQKTEVDTDVNTDVDNKNDNKNVNNVTNNNTTNVESHNVVNNHFNLELEIKNAIELTLSQHMQQKQEANTSSNAVVMTENHAKTVPAAKGYFKSFVQQVPVQRAPHAFKSTPVAPQAQPCASAPTCVPGASQAPVQPSCPCVCICCVASGGNTTSGQLTMSPADLIGHIRSATAIGFEEGKKLNLNPLPVTTQVSAPAQDNTLLLAIAGLAVFFAAAFALAMFFLMRRSTRA